MDKNVIKPYLDISMEGEWPITEIIVGPGFNQEAVFNGITYYLSKGTVHVPDVRAEEMNARIQRYLQDMKKENISNKKVNVLVKEWNARYDVIEKDFPRSLKEAVNRLYQEFKIFLGKISSNDACREYIRSNFLASSGIVLRKSRIPYIY